MLKETNQFQNGSYKAIVSLNLATCANNQTDHLVNMSLLYLCWSINGETEKNLTIQINKHLKSTKNIEKQIINIPEEV